MRWRWSMLWKVAAGTVVLGVVAAMIAAPFVCSHIHNVVLDAHAQTWASDAFIDHMERNGGR